MRCLSAVFGFAVLLAMGLALAGPGAAGAAGINTFYEGPGIRMGYTNPCNDEHVSGPVWIDVRYHETGAEGASLHVNIHGDMTGDLGNEYRLNYSANDQVGAPDGYVNGLPYWDIAFHGKWVGQAGAPSFGYEGLVRVRFTLVDRITAQNVARSVSC